MTRMLSPPLLVLALQSNCFHAIQIRLHKELGARALILISAFFGTTLSRTLDLPSSNSSLEEFYAARFAVPLFARFAEHAEPGEPLLAAIAQGVPPRGPLVRGGRRGAPRPRLALHVARALAEVPPNRLPQGGCAFFRPAREPTYLV